MPATREEVRSAFDTCLLTDRTELGRLIAAGPDILPLLQRLGTGDVTALSPGDSGRTVLTTNKGRIVQHLFVSPLGDAGVLLIGGPDSGPQVLDHLRRYTFAEKIELSDESENLFQLALTGPQSSGILCDLNLPTPAAGVTAAGSVLDTSVRVLPHDGSTDDGYSVVGPVDAHPAVSAAVQQAVEARGGRAGTRSAFETYRVLRGIPAAGHELTLDYNPLEAGLWDAVSFDKGCYVGQEVVARLRTYDKGSRVLVGLELGNPSVLPDPGASIIIDGSRAGALTSALDLPGGERAIGLGYLKRKQLCEDLSVEIEGVGAGVRVADLPFAF